MTRPDLRDIAQKYDSINLSNYIRGHKHTIENKGYNLPCVKSPHLIDNDIYSILYYTN
ncbi:MAG: hypothetical protein ACJARX_000557 [Psychroserpens sp.]|jgi:hypothetical protein